MQEDGATEATHGDGPYDEWPDTVKGGLHIKRTLPNGSSVVEKRKQVSLVLFSGGIDSTYSLIKLLSESDDEIVAHHVHLRNREGRHRAEAEACRKIVEYCKSRFRDFQYIETALERQRHAYFGLDILSVVFEAGFVHKSFQAIAGYPVDRWTLGFCTEERLERREDPDRVERFGHIMNLMHGACYPLDPPRFFQLPVLSKAAQIDYLGPTLTAMCWTCRRPVPKSTGGFAECGKCKTCLVMKTVRTSHD